MSQDPSTSEVTASVPEAQSGTSLFVAPPDAPPYSMPLSAHTEFELGRCFTAAVRVEHPTVSRLHVRISIREQVEVEDLGSKNGTRVGGRQLQPHEKVRCFPGDLIEVGSVLLAVQRGISSSTVRCSSSQSGAETSPPEGKMSRVHSLVERIAPDDVSIILIGETGVGKEVLAERIHKKSSRRQGPFVRLHAASVAPSLFEAELFGHERGAFTGAHRSRTGLVEQAHKGTLFVDEVGELTPEAQIKLLRVLEDRRVRRVGAEQDFEVDIRLVAATHRNLEQEVAAGRFRQDLYFRLNGFTLRVPPLRDRLEELPELCAELLEEWAEQRTIEPPRLDPEALLHLQKYAWPGNIRELKNVLRQAALLTDGEVIRLSQLPLEEMKARIRLMNPQTKPRSISSRPSQPEVRPGATQLGPTELSEKRAIERALLETAGNQSRAAKLVGLSRRSFIRRLDKYDLTRPRRAELDAPDVDPA